jgi:hypothetical protein
LEVSAVILSVSDFVSLTVGMFIAGLWFETELKLLVELQPTQGKTKAKTNSIKKNIFLFIFICSSHSSNKLR